MRNPVSWLKSKVDLKTLILYQIQKCLLLSPYIPLDKGDFECYKQLYIFILWLSRGLRNRVSDLDQTAQIKIFVEKPGFCVSPIKVNHSQVR